MCYHLQKVANKDYLLDKKSPIHNCECTGRLYAVILRSKTISVWNVIN